MGGVKERTRPRSEDLDLGPGSCPVKFPICPFTFLSLSFFTCKIMGWESYSGIREASPALES